MHIAPFHFTVKNEHAESDFLGYLTYGASRRNKQITRVMINTGAGNEHVMDMQPTYALEGDRAYLDHEYLMVFATHMHETGLMDEYFSVDAYEPPKDFEEAGFLEFLRDNGATLKFW